MSSSEIEDVLSSIRRLVSEDLRPNRSGEAKAFVAQPEPKPVSSEAKLLLTPALRVIPDDVNERTLRPYLVPEPLSVKRSSAPQTDLTRTEPPMVLSAATQVPRPPMAETEAPKAELQVAKADAESQRTVLVSLRADPVEQQVDEAPFHADAEEELDDRLDRVVTSIGATLGAGSMEWEPETGEDDIAPAASVETNWAEDDEAELTVDEGARATGDDAAFEELWPEPGADEVLGEDLATEADVEAFDEPELRFESKRRVHFATNEAVDEIPDDWEASAPKRIAPEDDDLTAVLDEATLRDLVREVIREELTGELGTRMTRNIRKLVRAELNRMLTAQDFD